jgi:hypothetical protein
MLQVARLAPKLLGDSTDLVRNFFYGQQTDAGGFKDRAGRPDLYYTVFGLEGLLALTIAGPDQGAESSTANLVFQRARAYLQTFRDGEGLDFVHLCCLARCWASVGTFDPKNRLAWDEGDSLKLRARLEEFRSSDGGYNPIPESEFGTAYACFLALAAYQDLTGELPNPSGFAHCLKGLETPDGAWTNEHRLKQRETRLMMGSTNATAAAIICLRQFNLPISRSAGAWLLARAHPQGGFLATPQAPIPDLLSTATALHALAGLQISFESLKDHCLDFVDSLWTNEGAFYGHWHEDHLDCEYTYYGLLALGHLSL